MGGFGSGVVLVFWVVVLLAERWWMSDDVRCPHVSKELAPVLERNTCRISVCESRKSMTHAKMLTKAAGQIPKPDSRCRPRSRTAQQWRFGPLGETVSLPACTQRGFAVVPL